MSDDEYCDEMDALTAFLDEDEEKNPYDRDEEPCVVRKTPLAAKTPVAANGPIRAPVTEEDNDLAAFLADEEENPYDEEGDEIGVQTPLADKLSGGDDRPIKHSVSEGDGVDNDKSTDEEKSKDELIEELRIMREQLKRATQQSDSKDELSQELFSQALSSTPVTKATTAPKSQSKLSGKQSTPSRKPGRNESKTKPMQAARTKTPPHPQNGATGMPASRKPFRNESKKPIQTARTKTPPQPQNKLTAKSPFHPEPGKVKEQQAEESSADKTTPKKTFKEMFGSLASDDEDEEHTPSKVSEFLEDIKKPSPPEAKSSNLAGGENTFYQSKKKRVAHAANSNTSPPQSRSSFKDTPRPAPPRAQSSFKRETTQEPWEMEPFTRIRISNPVVSMSALKVKMKQRTILRLSVLKRHIKGSEIDMDWVTIGVILSKSPPKTSKNGKAFSVWKLNDLSAQCPIVSLFLFGQSHDEHWKTTEGSVVGLLNSKVMPSKDGAGLSLSIDNPQKMIVLGKSKDLGWCKGSRKDGGRCTNFVNKAECEWCDYHVQNQYKKQCSRRTDLQATYTGINPTNAMKKATQNVFYGGVHYNAKPLKATKNPNKKIAVKKLAEKYSDEVKEELKCVTVLSKDRLEEDTTVKISGSTKQFHSLLSKPSSGAQNFLRHMVDVDTAVNLIPVAAKDLLREHKTSMIRSRKRKIEAAAGRSSGKENSPSISRKTTSQFQNEKELRIKSKQEILLAKLKKEVKLKAPSENGSQINEVGPRIGASLPPGGDVDLDFGEESMSVLGPRKGALRMTQEELSKARAVALVKKKGQIEKKNPNETQRSKKPLDEEAADAIRRRTKENRKSSSDEQTEEEQPKKKRRKMIMGELVDLDSDEMKAVLEGSSLYKGELEADLEEKYFNEMEQREKLETKMDAIMEKEVNVVSCKQCKFTWFCPSPLCKKESHSLKWHNATQRFFQCQGCKLRSITFFKYPTKRCRGCGSGKFVRVSMLNVKEKKDEDSLLLRGEERKWVM